MKILSILMLGTIAMASSPDSVSHFFAQSEKQLETKIQCREIKAALHDILIEAAPSLRKKRYKDYQGKTDQWSITVLLGKYFVTSKGILSEKEFFRDYRKKQAKLFFRSQFDQLGDCSSYTGD